MVAALPQIPSLPWPASPEQGSVTWGSSRWVYTAWGRATPLWCAVCRPATPVPTPISSRGIAIAWAGTRCTCSEIGRTRNRCRTAGARAARRAQRFVYDPAALEGAPLPGPDGRTEWDDVVRWALARLPSESREAFLLKHVEELEYEDMARLTGAGVSALKMRVKRAREQLQAMLKEVERV